MSDKTYFDPLLDRDFVFELAKRGKVSLTSSQITVAGSEVNLDGIVIPPHIRLEYMYCRHNDREGEASLRFVVKREEKFNE
jgi:hypothetical protein